MALPTPAPQIGYWSQSLDYVRRSPIASHFLVRLAVLLGVYWWLEDNISSAGHLPHEAYEQSVILWQCIKHDAPEAMLFLLMPLIALFSRLGRRGWDAVGNGHATKLLVMALVASLAWAFSAYNYNHYFDQSHLGDRIFLVILAVGCWFHPAFVFPFLLQTIAIATQFHHPIGRYSWTDKIVLVRVLMLFAASLVTVAIWKRRVAREFALAAACAVAAHYFIPGVAKVELNWWEHNQLHFLTAGAVANGWLSFMDGDTVVRFMEFLKAQNEVGIWATLLLEAGAVLFLIHRRVAIGFLSGWILLHLGILLVSGICFWKWMVMDVGFILYLLRSPPRLQRWLFTWPRFATSLVLIGLGGWFFSPVRLGWHDTCVSYTFDCSGRGASGQVYEISKEAFAPYDFFFSQNRLFFMADRRHLTETFGTTRDGVIAQRLNDMPRNLREISALELELGDYKFDPQRAEVGVEFFERFFRTWNRRLERANRSPLRAPLHVWTKNLPSAYHGQEPLVSVEVRLTTWLYDQQQGVCPVSQQLVREIPIEPQTDNALERLARRR